MTDMTDKLMLYDMYLPPLRHPLCYSVIMCAASQTQTFGMKLYNCIV